jgi:hypothetical protein
MSGAVAFEGPSTVVVFVFGDVVFAGAASAPPVLSRRRASDPNFICNKNIVMVDCREDNLLR